jgi:hypothetical protein
MSAEDFPSGRWVGYYTYLRRPKRYRMDLVLEFVNGRITGEGYDGIGPFIISGTYSVESKECSWNKTYVARHTVRYAGVRDGKGIWGTWTITPKWNGGFHIWPECEGSVVVTIAEEEAVLQPLS